MAVSSLPVCWGRGSVILVTVLVPWWCHPCDQLSPGWEYGGVTLVTGLGMWWHLETWWDRPCPCHHGDKMTSSLPLGWGHSGAMVVWVLGVFWEC